MDLREWWLDSPHNIIRECESLCQSFDQCSVEGIMPTGDDVLMGRGKSYRYNPGNVLFNGTAKFSVSGCGAGLLRDTDPPLHNCWAGLVVTNLDRFVGTTDPMKKKLIVCEIMCRIFEKGCFLREMNGAWTVVSTDETEREVFLVLKFLERKRQRLRCYSVFHPRHSHQTGGLQSQADLPLSHASLSPRLPCRCNCCAMNGFDSGSGVLSGECCDWYNDGTKASLYGCVDSRYEPDAVSDGSSLNQPFETVGRPAPDSWASVDFSPDDYPSQVAANVGHASVYCSKVSQRQFLQRDTSLGQIDTAELMDSFRDFEW
jgi:hypothetical protein